MKPRSRTPAGALRRYTSRTLLLALVAPIAMYGRAAAQAPARSAYEELQIFSGVLNDIRVNYVDSVTYGYLVRAAIDGVLGALDPHSYFVSRADFERRNALERGELATIGVALEDVDGMATVLAVAPESPAAKKGILPGDRIRAVDDTSVIGQEVNSLGLRLAGPKGSKVRVGIARGSRLEPDTFSVTIKRDAFDVHTVTRPLMIDSVTGYLRLREFEEHSPQELQDGVGRLKDRGAKRLILDLRGNPGGVVTSSVDIASLFLPKNTLVFRTRGRKHDVDEDYVTKHDGKFMSLPLIVLIDERSASAAEALAASLQDHDRALLVGRRSFGKALMQTVFFLPSGDNVWLTVGRVLTPSGRFIQRQYSGLRLEQYWALAGHAGAARDTAEVFHTDHGRVVRGGGGIVPDSALPSPPGAPGWWSVAADSGFDDAVSDSAAATLDSTQAGRLGWQTDRARWSALLVPFLDRVRTHLHVRATPDTAVANAIAQRLAWRAAIVRWGGDAGDAFSVGNDSDIQTAAGLFPRLATMLAAPGK